MAYLDAGSTQRLNAAGREALLAALDDGWADPARLHREGRRAQLVINEATARIAAVLDIRADELTIVRSGTHAVRSAVEGLAYARRRSPAPLIVSAVEHSSVIDSAEAITMDGTPAVRRIGVDRDGLVDLSELATHVSELTSLPDAGTPPPFVAVQSVNQETGTAQPLDRVADITRVANIPLVVDASQSLGREDVPAHWDVMTGSAHKWGGPAGIGLLAIRTGVRWRAPNPVRGLDRGSEGFPDVPALLAAAASLEQAESERAVVRPRLLALTERIRAAAAAIPDVEVVGHPTQRAAHLVTFSCLYVAGDTIVEALDRIDLSVASGSACASVQHGPSHVLAAMGVLTHGNVRIGLPADVADADVSRLIDALPSVVAAIRADAGTVGL